MKESNTLRHLRPAQLFTNQQQGAVAVYTAIVISVLLMFTALAVDVGHLYGVRNELHNAADAAALAGAEALLDPNNSSLTVQAAVDAASALATANPTGNTSVSNFTVQIGHWSFSTRTFTSQTSTPNPNTGLTQLATWETQTASALDTNAAFINAVKVIARRPDTPSFFARILNFNQFNVQAEAVAYLGFAGDLLPSDLDLPIGICKQSITSASAYSCSIGRMFSSSNGNGNSIANTAGWTNFSQPCTTANSSNTPQCGGNSMSLALGEGMGTTGGTITNLLKDLITCWKNNTHQTSPWTVTLGVIDCPGNNVGNCSSLLGAVTVNILWITDQGNNGNDKGKGNGNKADVPRQMTFANDTSLSWSCPSTSTDEQCWASFINKYQLKDSSGNLLTSTLPDASTIYFQPDCKAHETHGTTGGQNFGIPAKIPVLVQ